MTAEEVLADLEKKLDLAIVSHKEALKTRTDTGVMWRLAAYEEVRRILSDARPLDEPCRHLSCEMVSGRKRDYLYCRECETALDGGDW